MKETVAAPERRKANRLACGSWTVSEFWWWNMEDSREATRVTLARLGAEVLTAGDGVEALGAVTNGVRRSAM